MRIKVDSLKPKELHIDKETESKLLSDYYQSGDLRVLGKLYEPYMFLIYGLSLKYLKDPNKSEDAVIQIFELLVKKLRLHKVSNFKSWLYTMAKNHCLMELRNAGKEKLIFNEEIMESEAILHQDNDVSFKEDQLQLMEKCIEQLNIDQQQCVRLFYLEEKCYKEIVDVTGLEMSKVKSHIQNGKRNLKICMEKNQ